MIIVGRQFTTARCSMIPLSSLHKAERARLGAQDIYPVLAQTGTFKFTEDSETRGA